MCEVPGMTDPLDADRRPGRGASTRGVTPSAASRALVGAQKVPAKKVPAKKVAAKKVPVKKVPAEKTAAKKVPADNAPTAPPAPDAPGESGRPTVTTPIDDLLGAFEGLAAMVLDGAPTERLAEALAFLRRRLTGDYDVDLFGFDAELTETVLLPLMRPLYKYWFRVECRGVEHLPADGAGLVVANHSGTIPVDSLMTQVAVHDQHPGRRHLRMLGADLVFKLPIVADLARKSGTTLACNEDAERLLRSGELVGVWPEGFKGVGKPFSERYKLQRFGRGGFVSAAIRAGAPIVPCSIVGAEEIYPMIGNIKPVARLFGFPYLPVTPTFPWLGPLGLIPLPSRWIIQFDPPIPTHEYAASAAEDPMLVFDLTDRVRDTIQQRLNGLVDERGNPFFP
jgi:1-acyl-sn-glycerol-3-phosphate acyltransferase